MENKRPKQIMWRWSSRLCRFCGITGGLIQMQETKLVKIARQDLSSEGEMVLQILAWKVDWRDEHVLILLISQHFLNSMLVCSFLSFLLQALRVPDLTTWLYFFGLAASGVRHRTLTHADQRSRAGDGLSSSDLRWTKQRCWKTCFRPPGLRIGQSTAS